MSSPRVAPALWTRATRAPLPALLTLLAACSRDAGSPRPSIVADPALAPASAAPLAASAPAPASALPGAARLALPAPTGEPASPAGSGAPAAGSSDPAPAVTVASMLTRLQALQRVLGKPGLTPDDISIHVGTLEDDPGQPAPRVTRPLAPGVEKARISRYMGQIPQAGQIYLVTIDLVLAARPTIAELRSIFGEEHVGGVRLHGEREAIYYPPPKNKGWNTAVIASLSSCWDPHSSADPPPGPCEKLHAGSRVERLTFRRDGP